MFPQLDPEDLTLTVEQQLRLECISREVRTMGRQELESLAIAAAALAESRQACIRALVNAYSR